MYSEEMFFLLLLSFCQPEQWALLGALGFREEEHVGIQSLKSVQPWLKAWSQY